MSSRKKPGPKPGRGGRPRGTTGPTHAHVPISTRIDPMLLKLVRLRAKKRGESFAATVSRYLEAGVSRDGEAADSLGAG